MSTKKRAQAKHLQIVRQKTDKFSIFRCMANACETKAITRLAPEQPLPRDLLFVGASQQKATLAIFLLFALVSLSSAQSHRYWTDQYGPTGFLLSGAVVGGDAESGAIYYNPAQIASPTDPRLSFNADVVSMEFFNVKNGLGRNLDFKSTNLKINPSLFSIRFDNKKNNRIKYEVATLVKEENRFDVNQGRQATQNFALLGDVKYDASFDYFLDFRNLWVGFGTGYVLSPRWLIGASVFSVTKVSSYKYLVEADAIPLSDSTLQANGIEPYLFSSAILHNRYKFFETGFLGKFGAQYKTKRWELGVNITTPTFQLLSNGDIFREISRANVLRTDGTVQPNFILKDQQRQIAARTKDPLSIALGARHMLSDQRRTSFYATLEFFQEIQPYLIFDAEVRDDIAAGEILDTLDTRDFLNAWSGNGSVINAAIGYSSEVSDKVYLITGFRTDFNYRKGYQPEVLNSGFRPVTLNFDAFHLSAGGLLNLEKNSIFAGLQLSMASEKGINQFTDIDNTGDPNDPLVGQIKPIADLRYFAISLYFGFNIGLTTSDD